jgi:DNA adenine methylase
MMDALKFLERKAGTLPARALIYLDPPYYEKGRHLYYDFYEPGDHEKIYRFLTGKFAERCWVISYDNVAHIRELYRNRPRLVYQIGYSAREARAGAEVMFFSDELQKSPLVGKLKLLEKFS